MIELYLPEFILKFRVKNFSEYAKYRRVLKANLKGTELLTLSLPQQAQTYFEISKKYSPNDPGVYYNIALCLAGQEKFEVAEENYHKSLELDDQAHGVYHGLAHLYSVQGLSEKSIQTYSKTLELYPGSHDALNNRGYEYLQLEKYPEAINDFQKALSLFPRFAPSLNNVGFTYFKMGEAEKGLGLIKQSLEIEENAFTLKNKAVVLLYLKKRAEAIGVLERSRDLGFARDFGEEVNQLLASLNNDDAIIDHLIEE